MLILWIIIAIIVVLILWFIGVFNGIVVLRNRTQEAWSDIDVQLKRRHDLIPNLVETVKGYATHESSVFEKVTEARADAISAKAPADIADKENVLTGALKSERKIIRSLKLLPIFRVYRMN
jgi:LemA protein